MAEIRVEDKDEEAVIRVASGTPAGSLASAIAHAVLPGKPVTLRAVGAGAVNQGVKGIAIAQTYVGSRGLSLYCRPGFSTVQMKDGPVSAIVLRVEVK